MARTIDHQRRQSIAQILRETGFVRNSELSNKLGVSIVTIRQDIEALSAQGLLQKTYGGAVSQIGGVAQDSSFDSRSSQQVEAKRRIGAAAARSVRPGETIVLDSGSTTMEIARRLPENQDLTVVTCALNIALELANKPGITVIVCGGRLNSRTFSTIDHQVERQLAEVCADRLFLATYGVDLERGLAERNFEMAQTKRALIGAAREVTLVCDSSKFGGAGPVLISALDVVKRIVTDDGIPAEFRQWFATHRIDVETV
ncbi:MAG TPA: DeoR/GlpR family DNA-binding transcription regulator [Pirellulales bacterium]|nr:DeoR/GlpR family DNA-binding transcription regulator [Pirellulales bacterium]